MLPMTVPDPVMSLAIMPKSREASANFSKALNRFTKEDPTFKVQSPATRELGLCSLTGHLFLRGGVMRELDFGSLPCQARAIISHER